MYRAGERIAGIGVCIALCVGAAASARETVVATVGTSEEAIGVVETDADGAGSIAPRLVFKSAYIDGYCKRSVLALGTGVGSSRMEIGKALSSRGTWFEYALAEDATKCDAGLAYFRPTVFVSSRLRVAEQFLDSLHTWRSTREPVKRFDVRSSSPQALRCLRKDPDLRVDAFWEFYTNEGTDSKAYRVVFSGCDEPTSRDALEATVTYDEQAREMNVMLSFDHVAIPH